MILFDFSQTILSAIAVTDGFKDGGIDEAFVRHVTLNTIRANVVKFRPTHGQTVICCDSRQTWRKDSFPYYKASRRKSRAEGPVDWKKVFSSIDTIKAEFKEFMPYPVVEVEGAEADDVIAHLARNAEEPVVILSSDHDFVQLQSPFMSRITQYNPVYKKAITCTDPETYLVEHTIKGDSGDGIPNVMSPDDVFVTGTRQKPITKKRLEEFSRELPAGRGSTELQRNYARNRELIDLNMTPGEVRRGINEAFAAEGGKGRSKIFGYFQQARLRELMQSIGDF